jgi:aryl-alcohol dehydrogenase-like predicted oxidoreductase
MHNKIILGTANFTQAYGVLSDESVMPSSDMCSILSQAYESGIRTLDTAIGYGDITQTVPLDLLKKFKIITKVSALNDEAQLLKKMEMYKGLNVYAVLIHDPQNLVLVSPSVVRSRLEALRSHYAVEKIGVSAYDVGDIEQFKAVFPPQLIQMPLNPLNQSFDTASFIEYVQTYGIEVHARSLFLQGLLLAQDLPKKLEALHDVWASAKHTLEKYPSALQGLLLWASAKPWVHSWILGVSSVRDFQEILGVARVKERDIEQEVPIFQPVNHPLVDPRCWSAL